MSPPDVGAVVLHLIGYPGAGKYTVAKELAGRFASDPERRWVVIDNH